MKLIIALAFITVVASEGCWKFSYGRGVGKPISTCAAGLEESGLLCYPPCKEGYKGIGPVCYGTDSHKEYGRGAGVPLVCKPDEDEDSALCYDHCNGNYNGVGPVCWGRCPTTGNVHPCGMLCTTSTDECTTEVKDMVKKTLDCAGMVAKAGATGDWN